MPDKPISLPSGYAPAFAIGFAGEDGQLAVVDDTKPLPVSIPEGSTITVQPVSTPAPAPVAGQATASGLVGPFTPAANLPVILTLSGTWTGTVKVQRSSDNGVTRHPLTVAGMAWGEFTANACEAVWTENEAGAKLYLDIVVASGTVTYRLAQ